MFRASVFPIILKIVILNLWGGHSFSNLNNLPRKLLLACAHTHAHAHRKSNGFLDPEAHTCSLFLVTSGLRHQPLDGDTDFR